MVTTLRYADGLCCRLCWYAGDKYLRDLKSPSGASYCPRVLNGILTLAEFLVSEARILETGSDAAKKEAKESIPADRVKDGPAVARELRWRVKQAMGYASDDEGGKSAPVGNKRKRVENGGEISHFRNFKPKTWDLSTTQKEETSQEVKAKKPVDGEELDQSWLSGEPEGDEGAKVWTSVEKVSKVRRTGRGIERHRIERRVEEWSWQ